METLNKYWYIVYTKEGAERKVCEALLRKKMDSFYLTNKMTRLSYGRVRSYDKPLLSRYVFVCATNSEIQSIKDTNGIVNLVYWMVDPVTINQEDIYLLRRFFTMHDDIRVEKIKVNPLELASVGSFLSHDTIDDICLSLPVLGYIMTARQRETRVKVITVPGYQTKTKLQSDYAEA